MGAGELIDHMPRGNCQWLVEIRSIQNSSTPAVFSVVLLWFVRSVSGRVCGTCTCVNGALTSCDSNHGPKVVERRFSLAVVNGFCGLAVLAD